MPSTGTVQSNNIITSATVIILVKILYTQLLSMTHLQFSKVTIFIKASEAKTTEFAIYNWPCRESKQIFQWETWMLHNFLIA